MRWFLALALVGAAAAAKDPSFIYSYPVAVRAVPKLRAFLDAQATKERRDFASMVAEERRDYPPSAPYLRSWTKWLVVADTPRFLSLSAKVSSYEGGAHGNYGYAALLWDKQASVRRSALDLFTSAAALKVAIRDPFCAKLDSERRKRRGGDMGPSVVREFDQCIDPTESTMLLGSSDRTRFDRIGVAMAPYEAGSYAEGAYEVTLPVTPAVLAAVRPEYRPYFAARR